MSDRQRIGAAFGASAVLHAVACALAVVLWRPAERVTPVVVFPIALVGNPGGGGGGGAAPGSPAPVVAGAPASPAPPAAPPEAPPPAPAPVAPAPEVAASPKPVPPPRKPATPGPARQPARPAPPAAVARATPPSDAIGTPGGTGTGTAGTGTGGGEPGEGGGRGGGSGGGEGDGAGGARVAYDSNPRPPYPLVARRMGMEGVVLLEVTVAPDGHAAEVRVQRSSGHTPLDESAERTVRSSWRFIPARRDGTPIRSRVTVPIRFRLDERG